MKEDEIGGAYRAHEMRNYKELKPEGNRPLGRHGHK
jgi:hypothetical protein